MGYQPGSRETKKRSAAKVSNAPAKRKEMAKTDGLPIPRFSRKTLSRLTLISVAATAPTASMTNRETGRRTARLPFWAARKARSTSQTRADSLYVAHRIDRGGKVGILLARRV